jgi:hypothetical protein
MQLPEYLTQVEHKSARRFNNRKALESSLRELDSLLRIEHGVQDWIIKGSLINYPLIATSGLKSATIENRIRGALMKVDGVADVVFRTELVDKKTLKRPYLEAFRHSFLSERSPDIFVRDCENCLITESQTGTSHGSSYMYDRTVPIVFWGTAAAPQKVGRQVHTVDISATLASMFKLTVPKNLDGVALKEVVR